MRPKEKMVIAGAALVTAVAGGIAYRNLAPYLIENLDARAKAIDHIKGSIGYDQLVQEHKLPETIVRITRGPGWRGVDYIIREAIADEGSTWVDVPERMFRDNLTFAQFAKVEERAVDRRLEGLYLQKIHFFPTGVDHELLRVLRENSTLIDRIVNPSETYLVGINQTFIDPATLERISLGISQPR